MDNQTVVEQVIAKLTAWTVPYHDASNHAYEEDPKHPDVCKHCDWINPDAAKLPCGHTLREHALEALSDALLLQALENGNAEVVGVVEVVIEVQNRREPPKPKKWGWPL